MGHRAPAHCTALGKAFLAGLTNDQIAALYKNKKKLERVTPNTRTRLEDLLSDVAVVRREGVAYDTEEYMPGLCCIAAPIRDFSSRIVAAMCVSMFKHKCSEQASCCLRSWALFRC
jgi:DNA-binding IclR family transcriptional regulator